MDLATQAAPGKLFGERFQCVKLLKVGRGTATLLGRDLTNDQQVIIKTASLDVVEPDARVRLEHEAYVLSELAGPNGPPVIAVGHERDVTYVVMPFVPGVTLAERLAAGRLAVPEVVIVGRAVADALQTAHERGIVHRDIKPSNIIVSAEPKVQRAALIDFGFARSAQLDASIRDVSVGTVQYLSPEQAGLVHRPVDERSDLYAMGVVLYECAAGRAPFTGQSIGEVLRAHLSQKPPELRWAGVHIPAALDEIIQRLLKKDPDDRYQTAQAVLFDLTQLGEALDRGVPDPVIVAGLRDRRETLAEPVFVGRERELAVLNARFTHAREGRGGLVVMEAESGAGKSRLLEEFGPRCAGAGAWVVYGQGADQAAPRPLQIFDGLVRGLLARLEVDQAFAAEVVARLGEQREAVCEALPLLARCLQPAGVQSIGQEMHGEYRSIRALCALFDALGNERSPAVVLLDDVQWADELAVKVLDAWAHGRSGFEPRETARHVLIVAASRSESGVVPIGQRLRPDAARATITLKPFPADAVRRLVESMAGRLPDEAVEVVVRLADGSPFMATAVLQGLVETHALIPDATTAAAPETSRWRIDSAALAEGQSSYRAALWLARRLDRLPHETGRLLSVGAVLGKGFELSLAGGLSGLPDHQVASACRDAGRRHLIWIHDNGARCVFVHDKIREALLAQLTETERQALHAAAAVWLEARDRERVFDLAYHFDAAGDSARALPYAIQAAEQARARYALEVAEQQYRIAERGARSADSTTRARVAEGLGDVLMLRGRYEEADDQLVTAGHLVSGPISRAGIELKLGELVFKRGDIRASIEALERGLRLLGRTVPNGRVSFLVSVLWEGLVQLLHTLFPSILVGRRTLKGAEAELLAVRFYSRLAYAYYFIGHVESIWAHLREMNLAERYPATRELGQAYSNHIPGMELLAWFGRGERYAQRSLRIRRELDDRWGEGQTSGFYGFLLLSASRFEEAKQTLKTAAAILDRAGDQWERDNVAMDLGACLYRLGALGEAAEMSRRTCQIGRDVGEPKTVVGSLATWAKASGGRIPPELLSIDPSGATDDLLRYAQTVEVQAIRQLYDGQARDAAVALGKAWEVLRQANFQSEEVAGIPVLRTTALRILAEQMSKCDPRGYSGTLKHARRSARQSLAVARRYRNNLPHALREAGLLAAMKGKERKARTHLDESLAVAEQQGARFEHAQTLLARGQVGVALNWPGAADEVERAKTALRALGAYWVLGEEEPTVKDETAAPGVIDRLDAVLEVGRQIVSATTREAVWAAVRQAALEVLRGDDCVILQVEGNGTAETSERRVRVLGGDVPSRSPGTFSRAVVDRALATGRPVVSSGMGAESSDSLVLSGARSILCAPISVRARVVSCFYVTHAQVGGLFGAAEERLAGFIATLAGTALENVEGLLKVEQHLIASSTANLAHAMKTPVALIRAYLEMLRTAMEGGDHVVAGQYLDRIGAAADRISHLARRLHRAQIHGSRKAPVDLRGLIEQAVVEVRPLFPDTRGYRVEVDVAADLPAELLVDGEQVALVLSNLLTNAGDAMPKGGLIRVAVRSVEGPAVEIVVSDQGAGVEPSIQQRLFEPFVTTKAEGTGLGLWACQKIVEEHHQGRITISSCSENGTTVTVVLPVGDLGIASSDEV